MRGIYSSRLNKCAQFFILSAVIMASIIVSLATIKNYVATGDAPKKFYYYSQQLEEETGAVVDYALYSDPSGTDSGVKSNLNDFLQRGIEQTLAGYPTMEIFACYSALDSTKLICQNNGTKKISISTPGTQPIPIFGSKSPEVINYICEEFDPADCYPPATIISFSIAGKDKIFVAPEGGITYSVPIQSSSVRGQFYFLLKMNTSSGDYVSDSTGTKKLS
jgi:hypothetical protein